MTSSLNSVDLLSHSALFTDLYELTMAAVYYEEAMNEPATFSLFVRSYPPARRFFVAAGLEEVLSYLKNLRFTADDLAYLASTGLFATDFLSFLDHLRFTGEVWAIPEGRLFFANEPILEVTAPLIEAQIIETFLINAVTLQSMIATKAARCVQAAEGRALVDFSLRRTQGTDAGMKVARASYIAGFAGTSNVLAGKTFGIPVYGTMAHSFITSFDHEIEAFRAYARNFPDNTVLLIDTYDTAAGAAKAAEVGFEMKARGEGLKGVRLDSGNIAGLSRQVRKILGNAGLEEAMIFASGAFDEYKIRNVLTQGGEVDSLGVGTKMGVSADAPYLDTAYKLVRYANRPVLKLSPGKATLAGAKQVFRFPLSEGKLEKDIIGLREERIEGGESLLCRVMSGGQRLGTSPPLPQIRERFLEEFSRLEKRYKELKGGPEYPVELSPGLQKLQARITAEVTAKELA